MQITCFSKDNGPLTKRIRLTEDGAKSDGSACIMSSGMARRVHFGGIGDLAELISELKSHEAIALGALRPDLPGQVAITTRRRLNTLNGSASDAVIARTANHITYQPD